MPTLLTPTSPRLPVRSRQVRRYQEFADALRQLREGLNESQGEMADRLGRSQSFVSQLHTGRVKPSIPLLQDLRTEYGIDLDEWMRLGKLLEDPADNEDERVTIAQLAAEAVVKRLLESIRMESLADEFLRRLAALQEKHGISPRMPYLRGGPEALTRESLDGLLADLDQLMEREAKEISESAKGEPEPPSPT